MDDDNKTLLQRLEINVLTIVIGVLFVIIFFYIFKFFYYMIDDISKHDLDNKKRYVKTKRKLTSMVVIVLICIFLIMLALFIYKDHIE